MRRFKVKSFFDFLKENGIIITFSIILIFGLTIYFKFFLKREPIKSKYEEIILTKPEEVRDK